MSELSKRQQRRANRKFTGSRPNRRAARRLAQNMAIYERICVLDKNNGKSATKPGASKKW